MAAVVPLYRVYLGSRPGTRSAALDEAAARKAEAAALRKLERVLHRHFRSSTVIPAQGYWKGRPERSYLIAVSADPANLLRSGEDPWAAALRGLKRAFRQEMILVEKAGDCRVL